MARHIGQLPETYIEKLEKMSRFEIAIEAARLRSDGRLPGTATALILRWVRRTSATKELYHSFERVYSACWAAEQTARRESLSARPVSRPVRGGRPLRSLHRLESAHVLA